AQGCHHKSLYTREIYTEIPHWIGTKPDIISGQIKIANNKENIRIRYQHFLEPVPCDSILINKVNGKIDKKNYLKVSISQPLKSVACGQYCVFYHSNICLGSAKIVNVVSLRENYKF
ncbi:hypothetical protein A3Q56_07518, partial [Intoshia linei]